MAPISKFTAPPGSRGSSGGPDYEAFAKALSALDEKRLRECLAQGINPNLPDAKGRLPLHAVLRVKGDKRVQGAVEALLAGGADPNRMDMSGAPGRTCFLAALEADQGDSILMTLLRAGADPVAEEDVGMPTLHYLALQGRYAVLEAVRAAGVDIDRRDARGRTALMAAAREGFAKTVEVLLECGADPGARDGQGFSVLQHAHSAPQDSGGAEVVRLLTRALTDTGIRAELKQLRAEIEALGEAVEKSIGSGSVPQDTEK